MKYIIAALCGFFIASAHAAPLKSLSMHFNQHVVVHITNQDCPMPEHSGKYPWAAVASRDDGQQLVGCYRGVGEYIEIQWQDVGDLKGDITSFPANAFLQTQL